MKPEAIAREAVHRVTRLIGARKIKTQNVPVVLEPQMTASLLGFFCGCIMGSGVYLKQTFLADKLGQKVGNKNAHIVDDGLMPGVPGAKPFDGEGVPIQKTVILEEGFLKNFLLDTYSARKLQMTSTGHASGPNNVYLIPGDKTPEEIVSSVDSGFLLTGTIGHGTVPTTGDISWGAFGLWIEKGEVAYPVAEVTISGNLGRILNEIEMVGNDLEFKRSINGPTIKIQEMTIGGK